MRRAHTESVSKREQMTWKHLWATRARLPSAAHWDCVYTCRLPAELQSRCLKLDPLDDERKVATCKATQQAACTTSQNRNKDANILKTNA